MVLCLFLCFKTIPSLLTRWELLIQRPMEKQHKLVLGFTGLSEDQKPPSGLLGQYDFWL